MQSSNLFQLEAFSSIPCRWNSFFRLIRWCCLDHCCLDLVWLDSKMATCVFSFDYQENIPTNLMQHFDPVFWNTFFCLVVFHHLFSKKTTIILWWNLLLVSKFTTISFKQHWKKSGFQKSTEFNFIFRIVLFHMAQCTFLN